MNVQGRRRRQQQQQQQHSTNAPYPYTVCLPRTLHTDSMLT
jgi:hypothetical protein